jgi:DeoR family transcriptional regulator, aga operon transcriptional repressor
MQQIEGSHKTTVERRKLIYEQLEEDGQVMVEDLSKKFNVSEVTIRKDLEALESKNLLLRARGGAIKTQNNVGTDYPISEKNKLHLKAKSAIGQLAATLLDHGDTIIIDSGSTTQEFANHIPPHLEITAITNALNIASVLSRKPNINVIVPGGSLRKNSLSLVGPLAERTFNTLHVDKVFLGIDGIDIRTGFYTPNIEEAYLNRIFLDISKQTIILSDSSKFQKKSLNLVGTLSDIDILVTDSNIESHDKKALEEAKVKVMIAKNGPSLI